MEYYLPSEVARLVLGYLKEESCMETYRTFLKECCHLKEYSLLLERGLLYPTSIGGKSLKKILEDYGHSEEIVSKNKSVEALWIQLDALMSQLRKFYSAYQIKDISLENHKHQTKQPTVAKKTKQHVILQSSQSAMPQIYLTPVSLFGTPGGGIKIVRKDNTSTRHVKSFSSPETKFQSTSCNGHNSFEDHGIKRTAKLSETRGRTLPYADAMTTCSAENTKTSDSLLVSCSAASCFVTANVPAMESTTVQSNMLSESKSISTFSTFSPVMCPSLTSQTSTGMTCVKPPKLQKSKCTQIKSAEELHRGKEKKTHLIQHSLLQETLDKDVPFTGLVIHKDNSNTLQGGTDNEIPRNKATVDRDYLDTSVQFQVDMEDGVICHNETFTSDSRKSVSSITNCEKQKTTSCNIEVEEEPKCQMMLRTPVKDDHHMSCHRALVKSPRRKSHAPKRRGLECAIPNLPAVKKPGSDSSNSMDATLGMTHEPDLPTLLLEGLIKNEKLAEVLAANINRKLTSSEQKITSVIETLPGTINKVPAADPAKDESSSEIARTETILNSIQDTVEAGHTLENQQKTSSTSVIPDTCHELDAILDMGESQMSEDAIQEIIEMTRNDPDFDLLFNMFHMDKTQFIEKEYGDHLKMKCSSISKTDKVDESGLFTEDSHQNSMSYLSTPECSSPADKDSSVLCNPSTQVDEHSEMHLPSSRKLIDETHTHDGYLISESQDTHVSHYSASEKHYPKLTCAASTISSVSELSSPYRYAYDSAVYPSTLQSVKILHPGDENKVETIEILTPSVPVGTFSGASTNTVCSLQGQVLTIPDPHFLATKEAVGNSKNKGKMNRKTKKINTVVPLSEYNKVSSMKFNRNIGTKMKFKSQSSLDSNEQFCTNIQVCKRKRKLPVISTAGIQMNTDPKMRCEEKLVIKDSVKATSMIQHAESKQCIQIKHRSLLQELRNSSLKKQAPMKSNPSSQEICLSMPLNFTDFPKVSLPYEDSFSTQMPSTIQKGGLIGETEKVKPNISETGCKNKPKKQTKPKTKQKTLSIPGSKTNRKKVKHEETQAFTEDPIAESKQLRIPSKKASLKELTLIGSKTDKMTKHQSGMFNQKCLNVPCKKQIQFHTETKCHSTSVSKNMDSINMNIKFTHDNSPPTSDAFKGLSSGAIIFNEVQLDNVKNEIIYSKGNEDNENCCSLEQGRLIERNYDKDNNAILLAQKTTEEARNTYEMKEAPPFINSTPSSPFNSSTTSVKCSISSLNRELGSLTPSHLIAEDSSVSHTVVIGEVMTPGGSEITTGLVPTDSHFSIGPSVNEQHPIESEGNNSMKLTIDGEFKENNNSPSTFAVPCILRKEDIAPISLEDCNKMTDAEAANALLTIAYTPVKQSHGSPHIIDVPNQPHFDMSEHSSNCEEKNNKHKIVSPARSSALQMLLHASKAPSSDLSAAEYRSPKKRKIDEQEITKKEPLTKYDLDNFLTKLHWIPR